LHEEVVTAGGLIVDGKLERLNVTQVGELLSLQSTKVPPVSITDRLLELWPRLLRPLTSALDARGRDRTQSIQRQLTERAEDESRKITAILNELERTIKAELEDPQQMQLFGSYTEMEREQARRNRQRLADRLIDIPQELQRELAGIRDRFADPEPRLFPLAVTFLVPEGLVK
jgi:hypothetical protein